jgi:hypothetical protein
MKKKISNVTFINAVSAPPYLNGDISLNVQKRRDLEMWWDGHTLTVSMLIANTRCEALVPAGNIKAMAVLGTGNDEEEGS